MMENTLFNETPGPSKKTIEDIMREAEARFPESHTIWDELNQDLVSADVVTLKVARADGGRTALEWFRAELGQYLGITLTHLDPGPEPAEAPSPENADEVFRNM